MPVANCELPYTVKVIKVKLVDGTESCYIFREYDDSEEREVAFSYTW